MSLPITILFVAGTRPNFMKIAPLLRECKNYPIIQPLLLHTGQHYDDSMSAIFFRELGIQLPDVTLQAGKIADSLAQRKYIADEMKHRFASAAIDFVVVVGDVNSTAGGALGGKILGVPVAHVEAGLRSFDDRMPEEHNRIFVDNIAHYLFVTERSGMKNLRLMSQGASSKKAFLVGNVMIDTLRYVQNRNRDDELIVRLGLRRKKYVVVTMHRKENLEVHAIFSRLVKMITQIAAQSKVVWPLHPRTRRVLETIGLLDELRQNKNIILTEPFGYFDIVTLVENCQCVVTDSGGIQDETTVLGVPCLTIRRSTERPITTTIGSSTLVGENAAKLLRQYQRVVSKRYKRSKTPQYWDGKASERILKILVREIARKRRGLV